MTDQKPPAQSTSSKPPAPPQAAGAAPVPQTPLQPAATLPKPAVAPPLPKPNFSVSAPAAVTAPKPPQVAPVAAPKPPVAPPKPAVPPQPQAPRPPGQPPQLPPNPVGPKPPQVAPVTQPPRPPVAAPKPPVAPPKPVGQFPPPATNENRPPASTIQPAPAPRPLPPAKGVAAAAAVGVAGASGLPKAPAPTAPTTPGAKPGQIPPAPNSAEFKKSPLRFLPLVVAALLIVGLGAFLFSRFFGNRTPTDNVTGNTPAQADTVITYWGLWEPTPVLQQTIADFEEQNPGIKVNYEQQTYRDYRERLQTAIVGGTGPDVFRFHASWVPMLRAELAEMPNTVYTPAEFQQTFYPIANQQLQSNGKYVGVPLMYEGIALLYNKEILQTANVEPPKTWAELGTLASRLTIRNGDQIQRAGLAIGNASNVDNFSDVLGLLMLQNGATPQDPMSAKAQEAISFYTDYYNTNRVWDSKLPNSTVAFAREEVAMIFAPSWRIHEIVTQNPNIQVGVAPVPQLGGEKVTWASYWAEGVSAQSNNKQAAWQFLKYLSSQEALLKLHSDASKERSFGEIYSRVDMANLLADNPYAAAYLADAPYAQNWYLNSRTHDRGLNDQIIKYYEDAITALTSGSGSLEKTLPTVAQGVVQVLRQYNLAR